MRVPMRGAMASALWWCLVALLVLGVAGVDRRPVAHDDNMKDQVEGNKFLSNEASEDNQAFPAL